jgi:hypothetical protein
MTRDASLTDLERLLQDAKERESAALAALRGPHTEDARNAAWAICDEVLHLERAVASAKGEPHAIPLDFPIRWDAGAPLPHVVCDDGRTLLVFRVRVPNPRWDGSNAAIKSPTDTTPEPLALVEFQRCVSTKIGAPNDEVLEGHPLYGRGLAAYTAQRVVSSPWLAELERINSVHSQYAPEHWRSLHHYVFWFHDSTFECAAQSFTVEVFHETFAAVLARACARFTT